METLVAIALGIVYVGGLWKFWSGFRHTNFSQGRIYLGLLWPVLVFNKSYRRNFTKALKGS
ncbi:hypothetical protein [Pantanalinema sp. GBBB05]|uniref:hypothetical protein n=1 Tax=Pantanalinema sp. GBBB05 TaxID=2604139 RepID=UPI001D585FFC|nr:hypothetical protein [Pantanalinema sp. GBBB05]